MESDRRRIDAPRLEAWLGPIALMLCCAFYFWGVQVGWTSRSLPGVEYRQAQTAISAHFIDRDDNFSLAYPTPVLGKPWSIPMEFPLYQWTVVGLKRVTDWSLTTSGRAVSVICFCLTLPAVFLLLDWFRVPRGLRWPVLCVFVASPFYIFYSRAFLIETMALMFSVWFCVALGRAVTLGAPAWAALALGCGIFAALVKITTFAIYLLAAAAWVAWTLWRDRDPSKLRRLVRWTLPIMGISVAAGVAWTFYADAIKEANPLADFLISRSLTDFNLGTVHTRFSPEYWLMRWRIMRDDLMSLPALGAVVILAALARSRWMGMMVLAAAPFAAALLLFPNLYALHSYYFAANLPWLLIALGLGLVAVMEARIAFGLKALCCGVVLLSQVHHYVTTYFPVQRIVSTGESIGREMRRFTEPDEVLVLANQDWNSMIPYASERRALMLRSDIVGNSPRMSEALARLDDERVGAFIAAGDAARDPFLIAQLQALGIDPAPVFHSGNLAIFLRAERIEQAIRDYSLHPPGDLVLAVGRERVGDAMLPPVAPGWHSLADTHAAVRSAFNGMRPNPVRFFVSHGLVVERAGGRYEFGAHPETRLVFPLTSGKWGFSTRVRFSPDAFQPKLSEQERTDGVQIMIFLIAPDGQRRLVFDRAVDPTTNPSDRNWLKIRVPIEARDEHELELVVDPGYRGNYLRDWVWLGETALELQ